MAVEAIIARYGLLGLFLGAGLEGETMALVGGLMAHRGVLPFWPAVAAAAAGSFVADQTFFLLGRRFRAHSLVRRAQARPAFARAIAAFERRPLIFTFLFRFLYGLRTVSPVAIGTTRMRVSTFMIVNGVAAAVWGALFVSLGAGFGQAIERFFGRARSFEHVFIGAIAVAVLGGIALHLWRRYRMS